MIIKPFEWSNIPDILKLFELSFKKKMSLEYWEWRFKNNVFNPNPYIDLMWDGDQLVGHYAVSPVDMMIDGKIVKTALSMTTMTHPEYGGKGIFTQLAENLYQRLKDDGFSMVWGFPNNNSHYGFIKNLSWHNISAIPFLSLDVSKSKLNIDSAPEMTILSNFDTLPENLFYNNKAVQVFKSHSFLNWRFIQNPSFEYKIAQIENTVFIYKEIPSWSDPLKSELDILEIGGIVNDKIINDFISNCVRKNECILKVNIWTSLFSDNYKHFEKVGFRMSEPITYLGARYLEDSIVHSVDNYKNWDISFTYSDIF